MTSYELARELACHADRLDDLPADEANDYIKRHGLTRFVPWQIRPGGVGEASDLLRWVALTTVGS